MARRVAWTNNSSGHLGTHVYRAESLDPQSLPEPVATVGPVAQGATAEWIDNDALSDGSYCYAVQDYDSAGVGMVSEDVCIQTEPDYASAQIGDEIGGGIYAGTITYADAREFHLIFGKQASESGGLQWGTYGTTTGADDPDDGLANQDLVLTSFDNGDYDAFYHCRDYVDANGNNDYYLPARNELAKVDALVDMSHAEFSTDLSTYRWSSTEDSLSNVWGRRLSDGHESSTNSSDGKKNDTVRRARPVRRVAA